MLPWESSSVGKCALLSLAYLPILDQNSESVNVVHSLSSNATKWQEIKKEARLQVITASGGRKVASALPLPWHVTFLSLHRTVSVQSSQLLVLWGRYCTMVLINRMGH